MRWIGSNISHLSTNAPKRAKTDANDTHPSQCPTPHNQAIISTASVQGNIIDHRTLWKSLGFTDDIDCRDFDIYWEVVEKLKYNNPRL